MFSLPIQMLMYMQPMEYLRIMLPTGLVIWPCVTKFVRSKRSNTLLSFKLVLNFKLVTTPLWCILLLFLLILQKQTNKNTNTYKNWKYWVKKKSPRDVECWSFTTQTTAEWIILALYSKIWHNTNITSSTEQPEDKNVAAKVLKRLI